MEAVDGILHSREWPLPYSNYADPRFSDKPMMMIKVMMMLMIKMVMMEVLIMVGKVQAYNFNYRS